MALMAGGPAGVLSVAGSGAFSGDRPHPKPQVAGVLGGVLGGGEPARAGAAHAAWATSSPGYGPGLARAPPIHRA
ncbi:hypothetical protein [Amycolatopsis solani]|uniref:hypothetical protein n=1 Tax=Amycolatopsis solani TaxID=3028615 RepID=UPI00296F8AC3|nr:hypothetical protein [Amycolatopsis sp. MEP2-6]